MRLHTDVLDHGKVFDVMRDLRTGGRLSGVWAEQAWHGSRKRARALELHLTAAPRKGRRRFTNSGYVGAGNEYAATWDEWGIVLGALYDLDPSMTGDYYADAEHYHWSTGNRFRPEGFDALVAHDNHRWEYEGSHLTADGYPVHKCKCGALKRHAHKRDPNFQRVFGRKWSERIAVTPA